MSAELVPFPGLDRAIARDDEVILPDGRHAIVCETFTLPSGRRVNCCPCGTRASVILREHEVRRVR